MPFLPGNKVGRQFKPGNGGKHAKAFMNLKQYSKLTTTVYSGISNAARIVDIINSELAKPESEIALRAGFRKCLESDDPVIVLRSIALLLQMTPQEKREKTIELSANPEALRRALAKLSSLPPQLTDDLA